VGGTATLLRVLATLTIASAIDGAHPAGRSRSDADLTVTIRINDYAHVPSASLVRASEMVTRLYATIGVRTTWYNVIRFPIRGVRSRDGEETAGHLAQLTVTILTPEMAARGHTQPDALGFAVLPPEGMGRIAYVIYARVQRVAVEAGTSDVDLLGFVLAHEIGHLLGLRADGNISKCHWEQREVKQMDLRALEIPPLQARQIRSTLEQASASLSAIASQAGTAAGKRH
jgi:hypothetical protein